MTDKPDKKHPWDRFSGGLEFTHHGNRVWYQCVRCGVDTEPSIERKSCRDCYSNDRAYVRKALGR